MSAYGQTIAGGHHADGQVSARGRMGADGQMSARGRTGASGQMSARGRMGASRQMCTPGEARAGGRTSVSRHRYISARRCIAVLIATLGGLVVGGCVADGGYGGGADYEVGTTVGYGVDYYEPYGYEYGGCCARYRVAPPGRGFDHGHDHDHDHGHLGGDGHVGAPPQHPVARPPQQRPYHSAPSSHSAPSIPTGPRGGGSGHPR